MSNNVKTIVRRALNGTARRLVFKDIVGVSFIKGIKIRNTNASHPVRVEFDVDTASVTEYEHIPASDEYEVDGQIYSMAWIGVTGEADITITIKY